MTPADVPCAFHIGNAGEPCIRCGVAWLAHMACGPKKPAIAAGSAANVDADDGRLV